MSDQAQTTRPPIVGVLLACALFVALMVTFVWWKYHGVEEVWKHGGDDVSASASALVVTPDGYSEARESMGAPADDQPLTDSQQVVVVDWALGDGELPDADTFAFVLLDGRLDPPHPLGASNAYDLTAKRVTNPGWDGRYAEVGEHYDWLSSFAAVNDTDALYVNAVTNAAGVLTFTVDPDAVAFDDVSQLRLAMIAVKEGQPQWAKEVPLDPAS